MGIKHPFRVGVFVTLVLFCFGVLPFVLTRSVVKSTGFNWFGLVLWSLFFWWTVSKVFRVRMHGRAVVLHPLGFDWGPLIGLGAAVSSVAGAMSSSSAPMALCGLLEVAAVAVIGFALWQGPSYDWHDWPYPHQPKRLHE